MPFKKANLTCPTPQVILRFSQDSLWRNHAPLEHTIWRTALQRNSQNDVSALTNATQQPQTNLSLTITIPTFQQKDWLTFSFGSQSQIEYKMLRWWQQTGSWYALALTGLKPQQKWNLSIFFSKLVWSYCFQRCNTRYKPDAKYLHCVLERLCHWTCCFDFSGRTAHMPLDWSCNQHVSVTFLGDSCSEHTLKKQPSTL